ncbi:MAG: serine/threonine protein kinase, partial [Candidatus Wallbacteria bacterium]|nr:serine/threonine protein kinase [Candidatus Wallbacteria bacterium]
MPKGPASRGALAAGTVLAGFRIEGLLGAGGMGVVYRATQLSLDRSVALKVLAPELARDAEQRSRFVQEGRLAAKVRHPGLVRVLEVGDNGDQLFLAYELIRGQTLREFLDQRGSLPPALAVDMAAGIAEVLATLHGEGVLHRDLKPANLFVTQDRGILVGDLGIAKDLLASRMLTAAGLLLGTP